MIDVRRARADEWRRLRSIRLQALRDAPEAFVTTVAEAEELSDSVWKERARKSEDAVEQVTAIAIDDAQTLGLSVGLIPEKDRPAAIPIVSVFVSPAGRRMGIGSQLMECVEDWAAEIGGRTTSLWVVETNIGAARFYESLGYRATGDRMETPVPPPRIEIRYEKDLTPLE